MRAAVTELFEASRPEVVFHLAAQIDVRRSVSDPVFDVGVNVGGHDQPAGGRSRQRAPGGSSSPPPAGPSTARAQDRQLPLDERAECRPDAPYGQSKYAAEGYLSLYGRLYGLSAASLRLGQRLRVAAGPAGRGGRGGDLLRRAAWADGTPRVFGDGRPDPRLRLRRRHRRGVPGGGCVRCARHLQHRHRRGDQRARARPPARDVCDREFEPEMAPARPGRGSAHRDRQRPWPQPSSAGDAGTPLADGLRATGPRCLSGVACRPVARSMPGGPRSHRRAH